MTDEKHTAGPVDSPPTFPGELRGGAFVRRPGHPAVRSVPVCRPGDESPAPYSPGEAGPELFTTCSVDDCGRTTVPWGDGTCGGHP